MRVNTAGAVVSLILFVVSWLKMTICLFIFFVSVILKLHRWGVSSSRRTKCPDRQSHLDHRPHRWYHQFCSQVLLPALKYRMNHWETQYWYCTGLALSLSLLNYFYLLIRFSLGLSSLSGIIRQCRWNWTDKRNWLLWALTLKGVH